MYRVIVVDDLEEFVEWMRLLLDDSRDFQVIGKATSGTEALRLVEALRPDVVVTDVDMPGLDGLDVARMVRLRWPETRVVLVSGHTELDYDGLVKESGARVFIPKRALSADALLRLLQVEAEP